MTAQKIKFGVSILLLLGIISCGKDDRGFGDDRAFIIEPEFQEYVDRFFEEATARGINVPRNNLEVLFVDELQGDFCGYGYWDYGFTRNARVEILDTENCWHSRTALEKENFMFHELGHALLGRSHLVDRFENSYPRSLMCSSEEDRGELGCNNYQTYYQIEEMRSYYLDELFNGLSRVESPAWTERDSFSRVLFTDSIGAETEGWQPFGGSTISSQFLDTSDTFGGSTSLAISLNEGSEEEVLTGWLQRFSIDNFGDCSSITARAKVKTTGNFSSTFQMGISLRETMENQELHRLMFHRVQENPASRINSSEWTELEIYCVPERSDYVTISFALIGNSPDTIYIDEVEVELWD